MNYYYLFFLFLFFADVSYQYHTYKYLFIQDVCISVNFLQAVQEKLSLQVQPIAFNTYQALYDRFGFPIKVETMYNALEKFKSEVK